MTRNPLIERMNAQLEPLTAERLLKYGAGERATLVLVVGVPRSGTTLATQILARGLGCDYVDHAMAAFWKAPEVGHKMSQIAFGEGNHDHIRFESVYGKGGDPRDVHHYGYFWREVLGTDAWGRRVADPKWGLLDTLLGCGGLWPWVMQGQHAMLYAGEVEDAIGADNVVWVRVDRGREATEQSILRGQAVGVRFVLGGDYDAIRTRLRDVPADVAVSYNDMCDNPNTFVRDVADRCDIETHDCYKFEQPFTPR